LLVDYLKKKNVKIVIRGLRAISDFDYEFQMVLVNRKLMKDIETIFLMPREEFFYISSSIVKEIVKLNGNISCFVPKNVEVALREKIKGGNNAKSEKKTFKK
ncbi:MAG: pantetheine-phosphate adenylyltransferase, partial [bacterium]|nr:pantetheine-phosphate adenylyltransferase [bacterium]MDW8164182.1 pantetheine-phosphate adenylyltransferase [Candidatus Omnitrophota bacterium]